LDVSAPNPSGRPFLLLSIDETSLLSWSFASGRSAARGRTMSPAGVASTVPRGKEDGVSKEMHTVRVWAWREGTRELAFSADTPDARRARLSHVRKLQEDRTVNRIEMREHMVTADGDDAELPSGIRGSLGWIRADGRWRRLRSSDAYLEHRHS